MISSPQPKQFHMRRPHPFFESLYGKLAAASTKERRIGVLKSAGDRAIKDYPVALQRLEELLLKQSPFIILAAFGFYDLSYLPEVSRRFNEGDRIEQNHIELIQALILCHEEREFQRRACTPQEFQEIRDLAVRVSILQSAQQYAQIDSSLSEEQVQKLQFVYLLREHTKSVRNWGYEEQTVRVLTRLYAPLEDEIERTLGVRIEFLVQMFRSVVKEGGRKLQEHFTKVKSFMREKAVRKVAASYLSQFNDPGVTIEGISGWAKGEKRRLREVKARLMHRSTSFLLPVFAFALSDFQKFYPRHISEETIARLLEAWSCRLGELRQAKRDFLFLDNPVWRKPMLQVADQIFFWPIMPLFHGFCFEMMEGFVSQNPMLKDSYLKGKGKFLEEYVSDLFRRRYPDASISRGSKWREPLTGQEGENDLLVIFDSIALVVETKAGAINPIARRGGSSMSQEINQLLIDPARQAKAFAAFLKRHPHEHLFDTTTGPPNRVDSRRIQQFFCLTITLERFGPLATQIPRLQASGLAKADAPVVPAMSLADLEIALELLEKPFELLHYLTRRTAFELKHTYLADELDLLTLYLKNGFSPLDEEVMQAPVLALYGLSRELDPWFQRTEGTVVEKPSREFSKWWAAMLGQIEARKVPRRYELACSLLDLPYQCQLGLERRFKRLCSKARKASATDSNNVEAIWVPIKSEVASDVLVAAPVTSAMYPRRQVIVQKLAEEAMQKTQTNRATVILIDVDLGHWPYSGIYVLDKS